MTSMDPNPYASLAPANETSSSQSRRFGCLAAILLVAVIVGLFLYLAALLIFFVRTYRLIRARRQVVYFFWAIGITSFLTITNLGEADAWVGNDFQTLLFVYLVVRINVEHAKLLAESRSVRGPSPIFADRSVPMRPA